MKKFFTHRLFLLAALLLTMFSACDPATVEPDPVGTEGFYILNEGGFGSGNASLSFYDRTTSTVTNNVFVGANSIPLGDQAQSMAIFNNQGYIVVQNSGKMEVLDLETNTIVATVSEGLISPRYFLGVSDTKGYVTDWGVDGVNGTVKVIDLTTYEVTATIETGQGANNLILVDDQVYVVNGGGFGRDNSITVINPSTDAVASTITVQDNPNSLQIDSDGNIWVTASGHTAFDPNTFEVIEDASTPGALIKLDANGNVLTTLSYEEVGFSKSPDRLQINAAGTTLYYLYSGAVYSMSTNATELPTTPFIDKNFYSISVDPFDDTIIGCEAPDFFSAGNIEIYSTMGTLQATHAVGIGPNSCIFK
ncbi:MAG TPA: hypothetical protein DCE41_19560 [Cytophagales bacterium]|nr:hypothetical protein [Cytophagales bacterium]HAA21548.1 hypothetical protein [Cytophagales bacterium]HAP64004.1 hypothetical protein [Cytophagales bacterium]